MAGLIFHLSNFTNFLRISPSVAGPGNLAEIGRIIGDNLRTIIMIAKIFSYAPCSKTRDPPLHLCPQVY